MILFIEDEEQVRKVGIRMLKKLGYSVIACKDGVEALDYYKNSWEMVDLVILDMVMPRLSGEDTFFELESINPDIKVIITSGYSMDEVAQDIINAGAHGFIQKPFRMKEFSELIVDVLNEGAVK